MRKMTISKCPKCGSGCLLYKPDGSILCSACMTKIDEGGKPCASSPVKKSAD